MLVKYRAISTKMVDNSLGLIVCEYWKMLKPFIYARRTGEPDWPDDPDPGYYEEFERLAKRISDSTIINPHLTSSPAETHDIRKIRGVGIGLAPSAIPMGIP